MAAPGQARKGPLWLRGLGIGPGTESGGRNPGQRSCPVAGWIPNAEHLSVPLLESVFTGSLPPGPLHLFLIPLFTEFLRGGCSASRRQERPRSRGSCFFRFTSVRILLPASPRLALSSAFSSLLARSSCAHPLLANVGAFFTGRLGGHDDPRCCDLNGGCTGTSHA